MNVLFSSVALLLSVAMGILLYIWYRLYRELHFHAKGLEKVLPAGWKAHTSFVVTSDKKNIAYWYFPVSNPKAVVILIHGHSNPNGKGKMIGHAEYLHNHGYSTAVLDLRATDESEGNKITLGVQEWKDVEAVYDHIRSLPENKNKKIGFLGISMGGATAIVTAGKTGKGDFVIASVPYAHFNSLFHFQLNAAGLSPAFFYPFMRVAALIELGSDYEHYAPAAVIKHITVPLLLMSATEDKKVNSQDAKDLYEAAHQPKEYWEIESPHDIFAAHPEAFQKKILSFLQIYVLDKSK